MAIQVEVYATDTKRKKKGGRGDGRTGGGELVTSFFFLLLVGLLRVNLTFFWIGPYQLYIVRVRRFEFLHDASLIW